jgi:hypothetical protein
MSTDLAASEQSPVRWIESKVLTFEACLYPNFHAKGRKQLPPMPAETLWGAV